jgi:hypothetical protein
MLDFSQMDQQMLKWSPRLRDDVELSAEQGCHLPTTIASEVMNLDQDRRDDVLLASPVPLGKRIIELIAFKEWMDLAHTRQMNPFVARAQVIVQNYFCFVYLGESCFTVLKKHSQQGSATKKCCSFLTDNPVRAFRNAMAHGNWAYTDDGDGLEFWARKGSNPDESVVHYEVSQLDLDFWKDLAFCTASAAFTSLST